LRFARPQKARMAEAAKALGRKTLHGLSSIVTPDTLFRWHREEVCKKWDYSHKRKSGRPNIKVEIEKFTLQLAGENKDWAIPDFDML
jgi:hypothetical protein